MEIHHKIVIDAAGNPQEVIIPWAEFQAIVEMLGLDLEPEVQETLREARAERARGGTDRYIDLADL